MGVSFKLKIKHQGSSQTDSYVGKDGNLVTKKFAGAIEDSVVAMRGSAIAETAVIQRERTLFMAAVFFQRVVNRTPVDEDYFFAGKNGDLQVHKADDDSVRDFWVARYNNRKITAKQLRESAGVSFDIFNDEGEIRAIYEQFRQAFIQNKDRNILSVRIENDHERFAQLEYGEYLHDGEPKRGEKYYHGVERGYSVQAPYGMLRITQAEFEQMTISTSTDRLIKTYVQKSQRTRKVPSQSKMKELKRVIGDRTHLSNDDIKAVERIYE